ncbi:MAG TPA: iron-sulfur cluster assembly protein [Edaphocola sp.]|nr:iron-sulfur cluster assembly protein [Edaphocola sp.]
MNVFEYQVIEVLHNVFDPELPVNIYDLGLIYKIEIKDDNSVEILMTLTAPACPVAGDIVFDVQKKIQEIEGVKDVNVQLTFDPQWNMSMMTEEAKLELGFM